MAIFIWLYHQLFQRIPKYSIFLSLIERKTLLYQWPQRRSINSNSLDNNHSIRNLRVYKFDFLELMTLYRSWMNSDKSFRLPKKRLPYLLCSYLDILKCFLFLFWYHELFWPIIFLSGRKSWFCSSWFAKESCIFISWNPFSFDYLGFYTEKQRIFKVFIGRYQMNCTSIVLFWPRRLLFLSKFRFSQSTMWACTIRIVLRWVISSTNKWMTQLKKKKKYKP